MLVSRLCALGLEARSGSIAGSRFSHLGKGGRREGLVLLYKIPWYGQVAYILDAYVMYPTCKLGVWLCQSGRPGDTTAMLHVVAASYLHASIISTPVQYDRRRTLFQCGSGAENWCVLTGVAT